jgi:Predicted periplasmic protein
MIDFSNKILTLLFLLMVTNSACQSGNPKSSEDQIECPDNLLIHLVDLNKTTLEFYYKNEKGENYSNHKNLKDQLTKAHKKLIFATNGGMYNRDHTPQGLFIENGNLKTLLDTLSTGYGNFYLQPNGVFYLTKSKKAVVITSENFEIKEDISFATQSGPMLLVDGKIHPKFREGSTNLHIRNGVGILPDGRILFVMSKEKINFFDLATYFKNQGCQNALYLDGFVSRTFLPSQQWEQLDGNFGVIIGEIE